MKTECIYLKKKASTKAHKSLEDYLIYHKKWRGSGEDKTGKYCMVEWEDEIDKMAMIFCLADYKLANLT